MAGYQVTGPPDRQPEENRTVGLRLAMKRDWTYSSRVRTIGTG